MYRDLIGGLTADKLIRCSQQQQRQQGNKRKLKAFNGTHSRGIKAGNAQSRKLLPKRVCIEPREQEHQSPADHKHWHHGINCCENGRLMKKPSAYPFWWIPVLGKNKGCKSLWDKTGAAPILHFFSIIRPWTACRSWRATLLTDELWMKPRVEQNVAYCPSAAPFSRLLHFSPCLVRTQSQFS